MTQVNWVYAKGSEGSRMGEWDQEEVKGRFRVRELKPGLLAALFLATSYFLHLQNENKNSMPFLGILGRLYELIFV